MVKWHVNRIKMAGNRLKRLCQTGYRLFTCSKHALMMGIGGCQFA